VISCFPFKCRRYIVLFSVFFLFVSFAASLQWIKIISLFYVSLDYVAYLLRRSALACAYAWLYACLNDSNTSEWQVRASRWGGPRWQSYLAVWQTGRQWTTRATDSCLKHLSVTWPPIHDHTSLTCPFDVILTSSVVTCWRWSGMPPSSPASACMSASMKE